MAMLTVSLTVGVWYELTDLDTPTSVQFYLDSTDEVIAAISAGEPDSTSTGYFCIEGMNFFGIPEGKSCWVKLTSGAADVIYSQFGGVLVDIDNCAYVRSDTVMLDEVVDGVPPIAGFDDSPVNQISYVGLLHTLPVGVAASATINNATMMISFAQFKVGRTLRLYGIEESASITSSLTDYASLAADQTLTTAFVTATLDGSGYATLDLTAVLQELVDDVAGWTTSSPLQLWIGDPGSVPTSGLDETAALFIAGRASSLFVRT